MAEISAQAVKDLRAKTDLPMMECKQALTECRGDMEAAMEWLRKKHKGKLSERADRATGEGRIAVYIDQAKKCAGIIELQCETAPVAKNEMFVELANAFAKKVAMGSEATPDVAKVRSDPEMDAKFTDVFGRLRESMNLAKARRVTGEHFASYVHHDGKSGVLLAFSSAPRSDKNIGADLCMHTLFSLPVAIDRASVPSAQVDKVRNDAKEQAKAEGKPAQIIDKIAEGKVNSYFAERVLLEQYHVKTDDYGKNTRIADVLKGAGVDRVTDMVIMKVGA
jgi:elongation factor Ts